MKIKNQADPDTPKGITVYCASSTDLAPEYFAAARLLGEEIARTGLPLVTGAGNMGLMGAVNSAAIGAGGFTIGVIPEFMVERGWQHTGLDELIVTPDMHDRKSTMASLARGVIALPGGIGTFEELCEIITWRQLGLFAGNVVILNVNDYYKPLLDMFTAAVGQGFMRPDHVRLYSVATAPREAVEMALAIPDVTFSPKF